MSPRWFFAPADAWGDDTIVLDDEEAHHARRVLRAAAGVAVAVTDGAGRVAHGVVVSDTGPVAVAVHRIEEHEPARPLVSVFQGAPKGHKADEVVERLGELGVAEVTVFHSARAVVRWDDAKRRRLEERWATVARGAAKQSRHAFVLRARCETSWRGVVQSVQREPHAVVLWEEADVPMRSVLPPEVPARIMLLVGPEGGLTAGEVADLEAAGAHVVSLGRSIVRTENAAFAAVTGLLWHYGRIG